MRLKAMNALGACIDGYRVQKPKRNLPSALNVKALIGISLEEVIRLPAIELQVTKLEATE
ncbi:MAG: hypothetical protein M3249_00310 [Thermoproteota archaeon]|nr:hypothetical protein [Thermoproteota archaeon]